MPKPWPTGALLGARGNSGVILSQFFNGLAQGLRDKERFDGVDLARAFRAASEAAYKSVSKPVDGTMLSVIRDMSEAAESRCDSSAPVDLWGVALEAAIESLYRTPDQLPVLRRAGVVDAGGHGVVTLMEGAWHTLSGRDVEDVELTLAAPVDGSCGLGGRGVPGGHGRGDLRLLHPVPASRGSPWTWTQ